MLLRKSGCLANMVLSVVALFCVFCGFVAQVSAAIKSATPLRPFAADSPRKLFDRATAYQDRDMPDSALICYSWLIETFRDSKEKETLQLVGQSLSEMGQIYYIRYSDYAEAYRCLAEAESILAESDDTESYAIVLLNFGNLFNMYEYIFPFENGGVANRSRDFYEKAMRIAEEKGNWNLVCSSFINLSMMDLPFKVDDDLNKRMKALFRDSIPESVTDYKLTKALCVGLEALSEKDYARAGAAMTAIRDSIGLTAPRERYMANIGLSAVSLAEGKYDEAIECVREILSDSSDINNTDVHMEVYDLISKFYSLAGKGDLGNLYRIKYYEAKDSLMSQLVALEPTRIGIELDKVRENARQIEADRKQIRLWLIFSGLLVLVLAGIAIVIYRKNRQLSLKNKVIFSQTQSLIRTDALANDVRPVAPRSSVNVDTDSPGAEITQEKYRDSSMSDETRHDLIIKIEGVMKNVDEICDKNFSLQRLTALVGSNTSYISRIVNEHYGMSFANLLNQCRIKEACRRMGDNERYGNLTIEAISESVGFNTRSTFTKAFRLNIGMLPSEYAKLLKPKER